MQITVNCTESRINFSLLICFNAHAIIAQLRSFNQIAKWVTPVVANFHVYSFLCVSSAETAEAEIHKLAITQRHKDNDNAVSSSLLAFLSFSLLNLATGNAFYFHSLSLFLSFSCSCNRVLSRLCLGLRLLLRFPCKR